MDRKDTESGMNLNTRGMPERMRICLCSDFFFPSVGGIETHMIETAKEFIRRGHTVVVITRSRAGFVGVRTIMQNIKVYYLPKHTCGVGCSLPTFWFSAPRMYQILSRERITHVHGHQTTSGIAFEAGTVAKVMGLPVFHTEHSLFSVAVVGAFHLSKAVNPFVHGLDQMIAVSEVQRANLITRFGQLDNISVIPNGIDPSIFKPSTLAVEPFPVIVTVTRFEHRRGCEMLPALIKSVCSRNDDVRWIIAGGGSMAREIEVFWSNSPYKDRIELLGPIVHDEVANVLHRGHIFLNCSLVDAFCISVIEAVACGLYVVSTDVGGISEVLPKAACTLCYPCVSALTDALLDAINAKRSRELEVSCASAVASAFSWESVADKVLDVYRDKRSPWSIYYESVRNKGFFMSVIGLLYFGLLFVVVNITRLVT